ncbi:MAG: PLP-dependent aminotransferase family protein [Dehalococcoidia bacterium]
MVESTVSEPTALFAVRTTHAPRFGALPVVNDSLIRFGGGIPDPVTYPVEWFSEAFREVLQDDRRAAWNYGGTAGHASLRDGIAAHVAARDGFRPAVEQIMVTNGISQGIAIAAQTFLDPGDTVLVEQTSFPGSIGTFRIERTKVVTIPLDKDGLNVDVLAETVERLQRAGERVKLLYTIANFQNPTGTVLSEARRVRLAELAQQHNFIILQDDAYGDIRLGDVRPSSLFRLAPRHVVELGTFSKTIGPGLRVGWAMASPEIAAMLNAMRTDMGTTPMMQRLVGRFLQAGAFEPHLAGVLGLYRHKLATIVEALETHAAPYVTWRTPEGGFFLWLRLKRGNAVAMGDLCPPEGVVINTGRMFFVDDPQQDYFRLSFSFLPAGELAEGVRRMGRALAAYDASLG